MELRSRNPAVKDTQPANPRATPFFGGKGQARPAMPIEGTAAPQLLALWAFGCGHDRSGAPLRAAIGEIKRGGDKGGGVQEERAVSRESGIGLSKLRDHLRLDNSERGVGQREGEVDHAPGEGEEDRRHESRDRSCE